MDSPGLVLDLVEDSHSWLLPVESSSLVAAFVSVDWAAARSLDVVAEVVAGEGFGVFLFDFVELAVVADRQVSTMTESILSTVADSGNQGPRLSVPKGLYRMIDVAHSGCWDLVLVEIDESRIAVEGVDQRVLAFAETGAVPAEDGVQTVEKGDTWSLMTGVAVNMDPQAEQKMTVAASGLKECGCEVVELPWRRASGTGGAAVEKGKERRQGR